MFLHFCIVEMFYITAVIQAAPAVGKDNPPDLAHLVPTGVPNSSEQPVENTAPTNVLKETGQLFMHAIL